MPNTEIADANRDSVFIDEAVHEIYKELTDGSDPISVPFRTMKDLFMWAVSLGFKAGTKRPLSGKKILVFRWAQFTPQSDIPLLKAVALADSGSLTTLLDQDEILSIAEEYANAGIYELRTLLNQHGHRLWNLVQAI